MNKDIFAALGYNESKTLAFVKPFYCSCCHNKTLLKLIGNALPEIPDNVSLFLFWVGLRQDLLENHFER
jgi:hypothetical protein